MSKITDTLKEAAKDVLTEETLQEIQNTFNEQLESKGMLELLVQHSKHCLKLE